MELARGDVDADERGRRPELGVPGAGVAAGRLEHRAPERHDDAGLLGGPDEQRRREHAEAGVLPAHQRLDAADAVVGQRDQRLVEHEELVVRDRHGQGRGQREPRGLGLVAARVVHRPAPAPLGLGRVERDVRGAHELRGAWCRRRPARRRRCSRRRRAPGPARRSGGARAASTRSARPTRRSTPWESSTSTTNSSPPGAGDELALARAGAESPGHLLEHEVADVVAEAVVDRLEAVEVEEADPDPARGVRPGVGEDPLEALGEPRAVGQRGQRVVIGLVAPGAACRRCRSVTSSSIASW